MSDTTPLRAARERAELSREAVTRQLDPPISVKTLERWERSPRLVKRFRLKQLALIYEVTVAELRNDDVGAAA